MPETLIAPDAELLLEVKELCVHFPVRNGVVKAVDGVSLKLQKGRCLCIVGESGSGKSLTAYSILRLLPKAATMPKGEIWLYENQQRMNLCSLPENGEAIRAVRGNQVAMIFQEPMTSFSPVHTVGNQIEEAIRLHRGLRGKAARDEAFLVMERAGLPEPERRYRQYPHEMSGGLRQRAMIAMALSCRPSILLADEPTTALDVTIQAEILDLMRTLQKQEAMALMLITHDLGVVAEMADDVAVMYMGKIVEQAPVEALFENPRHPYTSALLASLPMSNFAQSGQGDLKTIPGAVPDPLTRFSGCPFFSRCAVRVSGICDQGGTPQLHEVAPAHFSRCIMERKEP